MTPAAATAQAARDETLTVRSIDAHSGAYGPFCRTGWFDTRRTAWPWESCLYEYFSIQTADWAV
jgi:hypothetical protein